MAGPRRGSASSQDSLFSDSRPKRPAGYETMETIPVTRDIRSPEHDLVPLPQNNTQSQYVTQLTQLIPRGDSPGLHIPSDISSPAHRPVVQVAASSPMIPQPQRRTTGLLASAMAPAGTSFRRPVAPSSPKKQTIRIEDPLPSSDDDRPHHSIKPRVFTKPQPAHQPPAQAGSFSSLLAEFNFNPTSSSQAIKRSADQTVGAYGDLNKRPRQVGPARAMPIPAHQALMAGTPSSEMMLDDIPDFNMRNKVKRLMGTLTGMSVRTCLTALTAKNGNYDDAADYLLLMSEKNAARQRQTIDLTSAPLSDDELMMTPAMKRQMPLYQQHKDMVQPTSLAPPLTQQQQQRMKPKTTIAQKYQSTQQAPPKKLDVFDTPAPQEVKKRRLIRGPRDRSASPGSQRPVNIDSDSDGDSGIQVTESRYSSSYGTSQKVLMFFNKCKPDDLVEMCGISMDVAEYVVSKQPYRDQAAILRVQPPAKESADTTKKKKSRSVPVGEKLWEKVFDMTLSYDAVDYLVDKCEQISKPLFRSMAGWGVDTHGKAKDDNGLDLVSLGEIGKNTDSGVGTPVSDDGELARRGFIGQPPSLAKDVKMKDYQIVGLNWLNLLFKQGLSGILADDMGLGKTLQTIAFIASLAERGISGPHLIVVPAATLENWLKEFARFAPGLEVRPYYGSMAEREGMRYQYQVERNSINVLITTYAIAKAKEDFPWLRRFDFTCTIYDEGHMLKNPTSQVATRLILIQSKFRLLLTGTPLQNNLSELMGLLRFLMPALFREREEELASIFKSSISTTTEASSTSRAMLLSQRRIERARSMLTPFILRRKKYQVLKDLPAKTRHIKYCELTDAQSEIYNKHLAKAWDIRERKAKGEQIPMSENANVLIRLRQAAIHPMLFRYNYTDADMKRLAKACITVPQWQQSNPKLILQELVEYADYETYNTIAPHPQLHSFLLEEDKFEESGKVQALLELLREFHSGGHRTLVFSQFVMVLDILERVLAHNNVGYLRLDGSTRVDERQDLIDEFNAPECELPVFMLSTKAGGAGINLASADRVIVFDSGFNPQDDVQAENRAHRIGQTRDVEVWRLITRETVEEQIYQMGEVKLQLDREVAGEAAEENGEDGAPKVKKAGKDELSGKEMEGAKAVEDLLFKKFDDEGIKSPSSVKKAPAKLFKEKKEAAKAKKDKTNTEEEREDRAEDDVARKSDDDSADEDVNSVSRDRKTGKGTKSTKSASTASRSKSSKNSQSSKGNDSGSESDLTSLSSEADIKDESEPERSQRSRRNGRAGSKQIQEVKKSGRSTRNSRETSVASNQTGKVEKMTKKTGQMTLSRGGRLVRGSRD